MDFAKYYEARDLIEEFLYKDLIGPVDENEVISDNFPTKIYSAGILYPQNTVIEQEDLEKNLMDDEAEEYDQSMNMCNSLNPSSMAVSFTVKSGVENFAVKCSYAWYVPSEKEKTEPDEHRYQWSRRFEHKEEIFDTGEKHKIYPIQSGVQLQVHLQKEYADKSKTFTVALVNTNVKGAMTNLLSANEKSFFQPQIIALGYGEDKEIFIEKQARIELKKDPELLTLEMLYRHNKVYGIGHGCSVAWKGNGDFATEIYSTFMPEYDLLQMKPALKGIDSKILNWHFLSTATKNDVCNKLRQITDKYKGWIEEQRKLYNSLPNKYQDVANDSLLLCDETLNRITGGINALDKAEVFEAFQFANAAMLRQRIKTLEIRNESYTLDEIRWYPFQLAFILQELESIINPTDEHRETVDLLWFPTGGGKTEAYLGLAAFTVFLRRIRAIKEKRSGAGTTIIMRYTLRLLTLQQFERASALICACELIRKENINELGKDEISIGLWVGAGLAPNKREEASKALEIICKDGFEALKELANPVQVRVCPWCGEELTNSVSKIYCMENNRMVINCPNIQCEYTGGLPIMLVDEDIYDYKPTLIVSTIDKFARMTWEKRISEIFSTKSALRPPELIIQDELHLISGPLGTIAGLYEIAIDMFCRYKGIGAKIIASTATIRNAQNQILSLYGRKFRQFPPQALDIRDSFFAEESHPDEKPSRKYIGIMAPGNSATTMLVRVYAVLLFATRYLIDKKFPDDVIDSYWTVTGYFNNLKQLGGAIIHVLDDVQARFKYLYGTKFADIASDFSSKREFTEHDELTSRKSSSEIGTVLKQLEKKYPDSNTFDFIMASNMISVGLDVGRLGLMFVNGQPKSNAEYIQATSRVGRKSPGLVTVLQDAGRSRDRSHFEQFSSYHSSLYKFVEATSLTPFSERARDRALHAVLISLCRHLIDGLRGNDDAGNISAFIGDVSKYADFILGRADIIDPLEYEATKKHLEDIIRTWKDLSEGNLVYQKFPKSLSVPLLVNNFDEQERSFGTLNSMRNVDAESNVYLEV